MTRNRKQKHAARTRSASAAQPYTAARRHIAEPTGFNRLARRSCSQCGAPVEWVDAATALERAPRLGEAVEQLGGPGAALQFWLCTSCGESGVMGAAFGDGLDGWAGSMDLGPVEMVDPLGPDPVDAAVDDIIDAYLNGDDPLAALSAAADAGLVEPDRFGDIAAAALNGAVLARTWRLRGARESLDRLARLVSRQAGRRLGDWPLASGMTPDDVARLLAASARDAAGLLSRDELDVLAGPAPTASDSNGDDAALTAVHAAAAVICGWELEEMAAAIAGRGRTAQSGAEPWRR